jgi:hypothetical protein
MLGNIFVPKKNEVTGDWRKLHDYDLRYFCFSPTIIQVTKSRKMRWTEHVARRRKRNACRVLLGKPEGYHLEDQGIDGRPIGVVKWILQK